MTGFAPSYTLPRTLRGLCALTALAVLCGCAAEAPRAVVPPRTTPRDDPRPAVAPALIRVTPRNGARDVRAADRFEVRVREGRLEKVRAVRIRGGVRKPVRGRISPDGHSWYPRGPVALAARYSVDAVARDAAGHRTTRHSEFRTYVPEHRFTASFVPAPGATVGTGMIVSFAFSRPVADRVAVERAVRITSRPSTEISGHWFGSSRLDFRPRRRWAPGSVVTVDLRLRDVRGAPGVYGLQRRKSTFAVGRDQVSTVDAAAHTLRVVRGGRTLRTLPVTAGGPGRETYAGAMVISEKSPVTRMNGGTVGFGGEYDITDVPHAMRLTDSGTFLHGNYWAPPAVFGVRNISHGCVGLPDTDPGGAATPAGWFYGVSLVGDLVRVINSGQRRALADNGLGGWNLTWEQWRAGSALGVD
ncbi:Ig-like domain-containing protein [Streptomyces sp. AV19]|uniref:L,D-transpeptidase n=1 Tax=Streptomyces sp. AV19 TaxID=2793068 RepID=UPI002412F3AC|nr:Ig-like domain-containing protein [Streptomyces sp. AV19]MDG4535673.1 Ig-like domain-containing protein [Streptomyces sp. AV19]